jgi:elongation factor Ts
MAEITAAGIRDLREKTGAGMMDCKKALEEAGGDSEKAVEWLRKKGLSSAAKRAGKAATEGTIAADVSANGRAGSLAEINCETDFVAINEEFKGYAKEIVKHITAKAPAFVKAEEKPAGASGEALLDQKMDNGRTVAEFVAEKGSKMGENVQVTRFVRFESKNPAIIESYIHSNGKIGVLLQLDCASDAVCGNAEIKQFAKDLSLHIAAEAPQYLKRDEIPAAVIEKEKEIARTQAKESGKPEKILEKIVEGKAEKFFGEACLLEQKFFRGDNPQTIQKMLADLSTKAGGKVELSRFVRFVKGETAPKGE